MSSSFNAGRVTRIAALSILVPVWMVSGCGPDPRESEEAAIDRETFIETQAQLRLAAVERETEELPAAAQDSVLDEHGVTEEALRAFVEVHGSDEAFMDEVWAEVDERVLEARGMGAGAENPEGRIPGEEDPPEG